MSTSRAINEYNGIQSLYHHKSEDNKTAIQNAAISNFISSDIGRLMFSADRTFGNTISTKFDPVFSWLIYHVKTKCV
jgi:hypothetical protein